jgi:hypothetical protein
MHMDMTSSSGPVAGGAPLGGQLLHPSPGAVPIIHPDFKVLGRLWVPLVFVMPTEGLLRFLAESAHPPSLCMLFQGRKCNFRRKCHQIHVDTQYMMTVTKSLAAVATQNCCRAHGDVASQGHPLFDQWRGTPLEYRVTGWPPVPLSLEWVAVTAFWVRLTKDGPIGRPLFFAPERVCQLHQRGQCSFGAECKYVHICRDWWAEMQQQGRTFPALSPPPGGTPRLGGPTPAVPPQTPELHRWAFGAPVPAAFESEEYASATHRTARLREKIRDVEMRGNHRSYAPVGPRAPPSSDGSHTPYAATAAFHGAIDSCHTDPNGNWGEFFHGSPAPDPLYPNQWAPADDDSSLAAPLLRVGLRSRLLWSRIRASTLEVPADP